MNTRTGLVAAVPLLLLLLSACAPSAVPTPAETPAVATTTAVDPTAPIAPGPVEPDTTLIVKATATAANGARLALELRLHKPIAYDDIAGQTLPAALAAVCDGTLSKTLFEQQRWSFARANISALPASTSTAVWPTDAVVGTLPSARFVAVVARGSLTDVATSGVPACYTDKVFTGGGNGALAIGIPGDTLQSGAAGSFTRWANHRFGFTSAPGVTLSACSFEVTDLGKQYGGGTSSWASLVDRGNCAIGAATEAQEH